MTDLVTLPASSVSINFNKILGKGAFGIVYGAKYREHDAAAKSLKPNPDQGVDLNEEEVLEAFEWEVARLGSLQHPNLVRLYGVCRIDGTLYMVMERCKYSLQDLLLDPNPSASPNAGYLDYFLSSSSSSSLLSSSPPPPPPPPPPSSPPPSSPPPPSPYSFAVGGLIAPLQDWNEAKISLSIPSAAPHKEVDLRFVWRVALDLAHGLAYLHRQGTVHRDVKPSNVLFDPYGRAKLADFGISQVDSLLMEGRDAKVTRFKNLDLAPEWSRESDIFDFGLSILEMLLGTTRMRAFRPQLRSQALVQEQWWIHVAGAITNTNTHLASLTPSSKPLWKLVKDCLVTDSTRRPSAAEIITKLEECGMQCGMTVVDGLIPRLEAEVEVHRQALTQYIPSHVQADDVQADDVQADDVQSNEQLSVAIAAEQRTIADELYAFIIEEDNAVQVLVALGEGGLGKSLCAHWFADTLLDEYRHKMHTQLEEHQERRRSRTTNLKQIEQRRGRGKKNDKRRKEKAKKMQESGKRQGEPEGRNQLESHTEGHQSNHKNNNKIAKNWIPILLRPALGEWTYSALRDGIDHALRSTSFYGRLSDQHILALRSHHNLLFILDGFDELSNTPIPFDNVPDMLGLRQWPHSKLLITSRPQHPVLPDHGYMAAFKTDFGFGARTGCKLCYLSPFTTTQRLQYLQSSLSWSGEVESQFQKLLCRSPELNDALTNPFVLHLFVRSWDMQQAQGEANDAQPLKRHEIYNVIINHWVKTYGSYLPKALQQRLGLEQSQSSSANNDSNSYCHNNVKRVVATPHLAQKWLNECAIAMAHKRTHSLSIAEMSSTTESGSQWNELITVADNLASIEFSSDDPGRRALLSRDEYRDLVVARVQRFLNHAPLVKRNDQYQFLHKTIWEYCFASGIRETLAQPIPGQLSKWIKPQTDMGASIGLVPQVILQNLPVLHFLNTMSGDQDIQHWKEWVYASRDREDIAPMAACAITALNGLKCIPSDLSRVRIPSADLRGAFLSNVDFSDADLSGVQLVGASLVGAKFHRTNLTNIMLGQLPSLQFENRIRGMALHPTKDLLAVLCGSFAKKIIIADPFTHHVADEWKVEDAECITFHPDGNLVVVGQGSGRLLAYHTHTGDIAGMVTGHTKRVTAVSYNRLGLVLASCSLDSTIRLWESHSLNSIGVIKSSSHDEIMSIAWNPIDNTSIIARYMYQKSSSVDVWDTTSQTIQTILECTGQVKDMTYSGDGKAITTTNKEMTVWDMSGKRVFTRPGNVSSLACSTDGTLLALGSNEDYTVHVIDGRTFSLITTLHTYPWRSTSQLVFNNNATTLFSACLGWISLWSIPSPYAMLATHEDHNEALLDPTGTTLLTWCFLRGINKLPDEIPNAQLWSGVGSRWTPLGPTFPSQGRAISLGRGLVTALQQQDELTVLSPTSTSKLNLLHLTKSVNVIVQCLVFSPDSQELAFCLDGNNAVCVWQWPNTEEDTRIDTFDRVVQFEGHTAEVMRLAFSNHDGGRMLASGSNDGEVWLWDTQRGELDVVKRNKGRCVNSLAFHPRSSTLAVAYEKNNVVLWEVSSPKYQALDETESVQSVAYTSDGTILALGGGKGNDHDGKHKNVVRLLDTTNYIYLHTLSFPYSVRSVNIGGTTMSVSVSMYTYSTHGIHVYDISSLPPSHLWSSSPSKALSAEGCDLSECVGLTETQRQVLEQ